MPSGANLDHVEEAVTAYETRRRQTRYLRRNRWGYGAEAGASDEKRLEACGRKPLVAK